MSPQEIVRSGIGVLNEDVHEGAVWRGPSETVKAQGETITTSQLFPQRWCITVGLSQRGRGTGVV